MQKQAPTITRVLIAAGFALSCFGLLLFLWLAFGGPIPLKPEGYRVSVPFVEAAQLAKESDVRISGVSVGKVKAVELSDEGMADATIELDAPYAPIPEDTRAELREKTLLGETYVELTPGTESAPKLPEGGSLPVAQVSESVQLDEIVRAFDTRTREAFQAWMQGAALAFDGRGDDLSLALASLDPFAEEADRALRILDSQRLATKRFIADGGEVFEALSERQGQLRGLISNGQQVFATTAQRDAELAEIFRIFPTFLRESRATLTRLEEFALETDPLIQQRLRPAARELSPTLIDLGTLAPELRAFFAGFDETITASRRGIPALRKLLDADLPPLLTRLDPYLQDFNSIFEGLGRYRSEITALLGNVTAASLNPISEGGVRYQQLRTEAVFGPEALASYPRRLEVNRTNPYFTERAWDDLASGLDSFETRHCPGGPNEGLTATIDDADSGAFPGNLYNQLKRFAFVDLNSTGDPAFPAPACTEQAPQPSIGIAPESTKYLHVREQP